MYREGEDTHILQGRLGRAVVLDLQGRGRLLDDAEDLRHPHRRLPVGPGQLVYHAAWEGMQWLPGRRLLQGPLLAGMAKLGITSWRPSQTKNGNH